MKIWKKLFAGLLFVTANFANATLFTFSSTGYIDVDPVFFGGYDGWGLFGAPGRHLDGLPFSLSVSYMLGNDFYHVPDVYSVASGAMPFAYRVTVDGHSYSSTVQPTYDLATNALIVNERSMGSGYDSVSSRSVGLDGLERDVSILQSVSVWDSFVGSSNSLDQFIDYNTVRSRTAVSIQFRMQNGYGATRFDSTGPVRVTVNGAPVAAVPEPATLFLFAFGLLGIIGTQRRWSRFK